jgi:hypothetical protein
VYSYEHREEHERVEDELLDLAPVQAAAPGRRTLMATLAPKLAQPLFRDALAGAPTERAPSWALAVIEAATRGSGAPLPEDLRRMLEAELRADLRGVRLFGGGRAAEAVKALSARAVTVGNAVVLAADAPSPGTVEGDRLLAHEAFHVVHHGGEPRISEPHDGEEAEARDFAERFVERTRRDSDAAAGAAVDAALAQAGITVPDAHRNLLATYYREGLGLTGWMLGSDPQRHLLGAMVGHCEHHAACGSDSHAHAHPVASDQPAEALDAETRRAIEHTTGRPLGDVEVHRDASVAARGRFGEALGRVIRLAPDVPGPDTDLGRKVRLHEAAHVAQQDAGGEVAPSKAVEADAHAIADAAERGEQRAPQARADASTAHGFDVGNVIAGAADALGIDPMDWVRRFAPGLVSFVNGGLDPILRKVGDAAAGAVRPLLDAIDLGRLTQPFTDWVASLQKESLAFGVLTGCCECLDTALAAALKTVQGALNSDVGRAIRQFLSDTQDGANSWLTDKIKDVTDFVTGAIDGAIRLYERARAVLGPAIQVVWTWIADALGLDKSLSPPQAIKKKLQELWDKLLEKLEPIRKAIADAWQWLCDETFVGDIVKFVGDCRKLVRAIQLCRQSRSRDPKVWLGILAREMKGTVFEGLIADLQGGYDTALKVIGAVERWVVRVLQKLGVIAAWSAAAPAIAAIGLALKAFGKRIDDAINAVKRIVSDALKAVAKAFKDLYEAIRPLLNFVVGFGLALMQLIGGNPIPMIMFFLGNLWLYVLPDCYKEALCNFVLDLFIMVWQWIPASFPLVVMIRAAALAFLRRLRAAPAAQKIQGMDMLAGLWAGDIEFTAGFVVGFFEGLWNSTPGLLLQLVLFQWTLPLRAMQTAWETLTEFTGVSPSNIGARGAWLVDLMSRAQAVEADADGNVTQGPFAEGEGEQGQQEASDETQIEPPQVTEPPPEEDEQPDGTSSANPEGDGPAPQDDERGADEPLEDYVWDPLPAFEDLGAIAATLERFRHGFSRDDITKFLTNFNVALEEMGTRAGTRAAEEFIAAMTARETPYRIGELVGQVVGFITGEVLFALIPGIGVAGDVISKIPQIAKVALQAIKSFPAFVRALEALRALIAPALRMFARFGDELAKLGKAVLKWFDDLVKWAKAQFEKLMAWLGRNFPKLRRLLRKILRGVLGDDLDEVADEAAEEAWDKLEAAMGDAVYTQAEVQQRLSGIKVRHPRDVRVSLKMVAHRSSWEVRATATKGAERKSSDEGSGWVVTAYDSRTPYYAPNSDWLNHHRVLDQAADDLEDWQPSEQASTFEAAYAELRTAIEQEKTQGQPKLRMRGIQFQFELENEASVRPDGKATVTLILTPNARTKRLFLSVHVAQYLGATKVGNTFEGDFSTATGWNWNGYPPLALTKHPVNSWGSYQHNVTAMPKPSGHYRHGGRTRGWDARSWRTHIDRRVEAKVAGGMTEVAAQNEVRTEENTRTGCTIADWDTLYLKGWEGHHIHEVSWDGPHDISNIIYVHKPQHDEYSQWWNARARDIQDHLGIPR